MMLPEKSRARRGTIGDAVRRSARKYLSKDAVIFSDRRWTCQNFDSANSADLEADIIRHSREKLAAFKVPKKVYFVEDLPKNASGKILKRELRDEFS